MQGGNVGLLVKAAAALAAWGALDSARFARLVEVPHDVVLIAHVLLSPSPAGVK